jgi:hypothetical protein
MPDSNQTRRPLPDAAPPVSWRTLYFAVLAELALLVLLFHALTRWAA